MSVGGHSRCEDLVPAICMDLAGGSGFHNSCIGVMIIALFAWVIYRLSQIIQFYEIIRVIDEEEKIIYLPSLGPFSGELKRLMRVHLSQIIKEKCSVSPVRIKKTSVLTSIDETTLRTKLIQNSSSSSNPEKSYSLDVSFNIDSELPFTVELFWGVKYNQVKQLLSNGAGGGIGGQNLSCDGKDSTYNCDGYGNGGVVFQSDLKIRRKAMGSSTSFYNQINRGVKRVFGEEYGHCSGDSEFNGSNSSISDGKTSELCDCYDCNVRRYDIFEANKAEVMRMNEYLDSKCFDVEFSPENSLTTFPQENQVSFQVNAGNCRENSGNNMHEGCARSSFGRTLMERVGRGIFNSRFLSHRENLMNSGWSNSVFGENTAMISRMVKRLVNRLLYRINNAGDNTESLLEMSSQINIANNYQFLNFGDLKKSKRDKELTCFGDRNRYQTIKSGLFENQDNINEFDPLIKSEARKYDKGLSQKYSERIKLKMDYINSCNLLSPYVNYEESGDANSNHHDECGPSNSCARVPLLIIIKTNVVDYDLDLYKRIMNSDNFRESFTYLNALLIHFDLIQDHYNIPYIMYKPVILEQYYLNFNNSLIEPSDTFGLEDDELDCLICMSNPKNAVLLPCKHCTSCESCLRSLRQDKCPLCRTTFYGFVVLPVNSSSI